MDQTISRSKGKLSRALSEGSLLILLVFFIVLFSALSKNFLTQLNLTNILVQNVHVAVLSAAVMIIMISGGCDLSIGYQVSVTAVIMTKLISDYQIPVWGAILIGIAACMILGTFNGIMAKQLKSHTMMITLGTMAIFQGISYLISQSKTFYQLPDTYKFIGQGRLFGWLPLNVIIMIVILLIVGFIMNKTYIGRYVYAAGDNPESARLAGLKVSKIKVLAFTFGGLLVGIAAVLLSSRAGSADSTTGLGLEFTGITACVLAGVALKGGEGTLWKVIVAVFVLGILSNGMQLIGLGTYPQYIAKGVIMLVSIWLSNRNAPSVG
jgi:ribose/xylose/arabinose/galactoside ABC-type transport system permease subunit